jgi:hypothetical protein
MSDEPALSPRRKKRRIRNILLGLVCTPPLLLAAGNLALATPWAKGRLAREVEARTGLETRIGSATWTPWGGASLGGFQLLQPPSLRQVIAKPLLEIRKVQIHPRWKPLLKGDLQVAKIRLDRPRAAVSLEMLSSLAPKDVRPVPDLPEVAANGPPQAAAASAADAPASYPPAPAQQPAGEPLSPGAAPAPSSGRGTTWIDVSEAELDLFLGTTNVVKFSGLAGKVPMGGDPAEGRCSAKSIVAVGQALAGGWELPLFWKGPELHVGPGEITVAGARLRVEAALGRLPGIPFVADLRVAEQPVDASDIFQTRKPRVARFAAKVQGAGFLTVPASWKGAATAAAEDIALEAGGSELRFGEASFTCLLEGGILNCPDARLVGESLSLLGNGTIRTGGEVSAVLRAVMPPEVASLWRARLIEMSVAVPPVFTAMESPDRLFIDLRWVSYPGGQGIEFGSGGPVVPVAHAAGVLAGSG